MLQTRGFEGVGVAARKVRFAATAIEAARDAGRLVHVLLDYEEPADVSAATTRTLANQPRCACASRFCRSN